MFVALYLIVHGVIKVFLAVNLLKERAWAFTFALWFLGLFVVYQLYRYGIGHETFLLFFVGLDVAVLALVWLERRALVSS